MSVRELGMEVVIPEDIIENLKPRLHGYLHRKHHALLHPLDFPFPPPSLSEMGTEVIHFLQIKISLSISNRGLGQRDFVIVNVVSPLRGETTLKMLERGWDRNLPIQQKEERLRTTLSSLRLFHDSTHMIFEIESFFRDGVFGAVFPRNATDEIWYNECPDPISDIRRARSSIHEAFRRRWSYSMQQERVLSEEEIQRTISEMHAATGIVPNRVVVGTEYESGVPHSFEELAVEPSPSLEDLLKILDRKEEGIPWNCYGVVPSPSLFGMEYEPQLGIGIGNETFAVNVRVIAGTEEVSAEKGIETLLHDEENKQILFRHGQRKKEDWQYGLVFYGAGAERWRKSACSDIYIDSTRNFEVRNFNPVSSIEESVKNCQTAFDKIVSEVMGFLKGKYDMAFYSPKCVSSSECTKHLNIGYPELGVERLQKASEILKTNKGLFVEHKSIRRARIGETRVYRRLHIKLPSFYDDYSTIENDITKIPDFRTLKEDERNKIEVLGFSIGRSRKWVKKNPLR